MNTSTLILAHSINFTLLLLIKTCETVMKNSKITQLKQFYNYVNEFSDKHNEYATDQFVSLSE